MKTIKCPYCGTEYLPGEIYIPEHFLGRPENVERDLSGNIVYDDGVMQDLTEDYTCLKCDRTFHVLATIDFTVSTTTIGDVKDDYVSKLFDADLILPEE